MCTDRKYCLEGFDTETLRFFVAGDPATKGSYNIVSKSGSSKGVLVPSNKNEHSWRKRIQNAIRRVWWRSHPSSPLPKYEYPAMVLAEFRLKRPKTVKRVFPSVRPDIDKLLRCLLDGLTDSKIIKEDSSVITVTGSKTYASTPEEAGVDVTIIWLKPHTEPVERSKS